MDTKIILVDSDNEKLSKTFNIKYSKIDDIDSLKIKLASELSIPYFCIKLDKNTKNIREEEVKLSIPFKKITKKTILSDLAEISQISFKTLENLVKTNFKSFNQIKPQIKEFLSEYKELNLTDEFYFCITAYFLFDKQQDTIFLNRESNIYKQNFLSIIELYYIFNSDKLFAIKYENFIIEFKKQIKDTKEKSDDLDKLYKEIILNKKDAQKIRKEFSQERIKYINSKLILKSLNIDEIELFERIKLTTDVPFICINSFIKNLKSFIPPDEFFENNEPDILNVFVFNKKFSTEENSKNPNSYSILKISRNINDIEIQIDSKIDDFNKNEDVLEEVIIERVVRSLNINELIPKIEVEIIPQYEKGEFYVAFPKLSRIVLQDIIMIDLFISKMFAVNEFITTFNKRGGVSMAYLPSNNGIKNDITTCTLSNNIVSSFNKRYVRTLKFGTIFANISFKTKNKYTLSILKECIAHLFNMYKKTGEDVEEVYKKIDCNFSDDKKIIEKKEFEKTKEKTYKLKDYLPQIFVADYSANCGKTPNIIEDEEEAKERLEEEGEGRIMKYPLFGEFDSYYYACDNHKEHKYPGLKQTNISEYLLPCCFKKDQTEDESKKTPLRYIYENDKDWKEKLEEEETKEFEKTKKIKIYTTTRVMKVGNVGLLGPTINKLFNYIDNQNKYYRCGVNIGINSCIEAILRATSSIKLDKMTKSRREDELMKYRQNLESVILKGGGAQNTYSHSLLSLQNILRDSNKFLDVRLFSSALQDLFNCYIVLLKVSKKNPNGELISPYFINNLYLITGKRDYRYTVILYETTGTRIDNLQYPHYEFICKYDTEKKKSSSNFSSKDSMIQNLFKVYDNMYMKFSKELNTKIRGNPFETSIKSQKQDSFGKIKIITFVDGVNILIQPIDSIPTNLPTMTENITTQLKPIPYEKAIKFLENEGINIKNVEVVFVKDNAIGIKCNKNDIDFYIPIIPTSEYAFNNVSYSSISPSFIMDVNALDTFSLREKAARCLFSLCLYLFSKYIKNKSIKDDDLLQTILDFKRDIIEVDENIKEDDYSKINRNIQNNKMIINNKILLNSKDLVKKVLYNLFITTRQNSEYVKEYCNLEYIPDFYTNFRDFQRDEDSLIFISFHSIKKWKQAVEKSKENKVYNEITPDFILSLNKNNITLFKNNLLTDDEDLYLCSKAVSLETACSFFNTMTISDRADIEILKSSDYKEERILKTYRGSMVFVNDTNFNDLTIRRYGSKKYFILVFKFEEKDYITCLFKYKR